MKRETENIKRIVVKVGSSTLTKNNEKLNMKYINDLVIQISNLVNKGYEVILVSSGAVAAGRNSIGNTIETNSIRQKQAVASIGQAELIYAYRNLFKVQEKHCAQILLVADDVKDVLRAYNLKNTFSILLSNGIIPIVNENDSVATQEIKVGDNDTLSSLVAEITKADILIILSDIDGLYDNNPKVNKDAKVIDFVENIDENIEKLVFKSDSKIGTGGMYTKISASKIATNAGISMVIASGKIKDVLERIIEGENIGTYFKAKERSTEKINDIYVKRNYKGEIYIEKEIKGNILVKDAIKINGEFKKGEIVKIINGENIEYAFVDIDKNDINSNEEEIENILVYKNNMY